MFATLASRQLRFGMKASIPDLESNHETGYDRVGARSPQAVRKPPNGQASPPIRTGLSPHQVRNTPPSGQVIAHRVLFLHN